ncbi:MAG TPA: group I intron-associated PD-(D/E)XK endonuclease [Terriglobales bacterium]|nr:group I intron-associated PD-(D/E)XK endonuclease [Terriglobales bacterium]
MFREGETARSEFKLRGEWAELLFMTGATEHGLRVIKPWGDSSRYDFVVETGGRFLRVQVKSTACRRGKHYACWIEKRGRKCYTAAEIDFFAIYVIPADSWYILPIEVVSRSKCVITLSPHNSLSKNACYKEAWHLLQAE